jgi:hypothetical protein
MNADDYYPFCSVALFMDLILAIFDFITSISERISMKSISFCTVCSIAVICYSYNEIICISLMWSLFYFCPSDIFLIVVP